MNPETIAVLRAYRAARGTVGNDTPIFACWDGRCLSVRAIEALFEIWRPELGWTRALHPHVLRHTHATGALAHGTDIATVADLLRHHGLRSVTIYAAVQDEARRAALSKLGALGPRGILEGICGERRYRSCRKKYHLCRRAVYEPPKAA